jgi:S-ribosylhomocysteine lyase
MGQTTLFDHLYQALLHLLLSYHLLKHFASVHNTLAKLQNFCDNTERLSDLYLVTPKKCSNFALTINNHCQNMEVIQSFTIDHTRLKPGIYVSREDKGFTTFDLRITEPNQEPAVAPAAMHSLEHLMATWFRNSEAKEDVVYVGPMGCLTGMYIIMTGTYSVEDMRRLTIECLQWILTQTEVPATRPEACGNYLLHDLPMCQWESKRYLDRLKHDFHSEYTKLQITLEDGKVFADA